MPTLHTVGDALLQMLNEVLLFIPKLIGAALWLLVGYSVARVVGTLLAKGLRALHFDQVADRAGISRALQMSGIKLDAAGALSKLVFWWIFLMVGIENAVNALGMTTITAYINAVLAYLPNVFAAAAIVIIGALIANVVAGLVRGAAGEAGLTSASLLGTVARWAILLFSVMTALTQLNIGQNMILILFAGLVTMLAIAGGLAFGLGGVESARSLLAAGTAGSMLQPGQHVQIGRQAGTVVRHDLNATVLDTGSGLVSIPNGALTKEEVTVLDGSKGDMAKAPQK